MSTAQLDVMPPSLVESPSTSSDVVEVAALAHALLDRVAGVEVSGLSPQATATAVAAWRRVETRVAELRLRLLAAAETAGTARTAGAASTGAWAAVLTHDDVDQSAREVKLATDLARGATSATRTALAQGRLTQRHAEVILEATAKLPPALSTPQRTRVEESLVAKAAVLSPQSLRRAARRALEAVESDLATVDAHENKLVNDAEEVALAKTRLVLHDNGDGTVSGHFTVPELHGHLLRKILETMTAPRRARLGASAAQAGQATHLHGRTDWDHARGHAFCELLEHLPTDHLHPKVAATLVVTLDATVLRGALKAAGLDTGGALAAATARRLACNAGIVPAVLGGKSRVLDLGREARLFSEAQRLALGVKHQTCAARGCERPYAWSELHHRRPWSTGGPTNLDQAIPLCWFHHRRIHDDTFLHRERPDGTITFHPRR